MKSIKKRHFVFAGIIILSYLVSGCSQQPASKSVTRIPVIYSTDLYQPPEDPDDHYDLAFLYCLEELEIRALIFDISTSHRQPEECGKNALDQMCKITGKAHPPFKIGLREPLRSPDDKALEQPEEFQGGVELILSTLEQSKEQVVMFLVGSCRDFAAAFNRNPDLLREKVKSVYINAGNKTKEIQTEWNVKLDPNAYVALITSGLPIYWCPCFGEEYKLCTPEDVSAGKAFGTFFYVVNQAELLAPARAVVKNYFDYALTKAKDEPLSFLDREPQPLPESGRNMWCTGPFLHAAGRKIYQTQDSRWIACTPENAKVLGIEGSAIEVFHFEPINNIQYRMKNEDGKLLPEFYDVDPAETSTSIQVFRYTHPDFNAIMSSTLGNILGTL
jgi:hypothetical protein